MSQINVEKIGNWYHKLLYVVDRNELFQSTIFLSERSKTINVNKLVSERLLTIPKQKYPLYISDILLDAMTDRDKLYILCHVDILFDPELKIIPTQLFEQISKTYKLVVEWPGTYENGKLIYAEYGFPEHFITEDFEGEVYVN